MLRTSKPLKPCHAYACSKLTRNKYCEDHEHLASQEKAWTNKLYDTYVRDAKIKKFYSGREWQLVRERALMRDNGLCQNCLRIGQKITIATMVHHIVPVKKDWSKRLQMDNLVSLCDKCHGQQEH